MVSLFIGADIELTDEEYFADEISQEEEYHWTDEEEIIIQENEYLVNEFYY